MFRKEGRGTGFSSKISDKREPLCTVGLAVQLSLGSLDDSAYKILCCETESQLQEPVLRREAFKDGAQQTTLLSISKACLHAEAHTSGLADQSHWRGKCSKIHGGLRASLIYNFICSHMHQFIIAFKGCL